MPYTLDDLLADVGKREVTDSDIDSMVRRLEAAEKQFEQKRRDKTPSWEWYHQIVG